VLIKDDTTGREISASDKRTANALWTILMLTRLVIPAYVLYAIYLYWTMPPSSYLSGGY
jgi:hypothetical protein